MDPKVILLVLCITFTSVQGAIPKCCVGISRIPLAILADVRKYDVQTRNGACDIDAVVLHHKGKRYCASLRVKRIMQVLQKSRIGARNSV
ncbi:C-C motif chemokine 27b [Brachyhypopomus gauderio]|uniref:C-C motif chemokine 27b n=1 Tax=Brachyhypopomus gauderio TaxID=698409 RepID=UPI0040429E9C